MKLTFLPALLLLCSFATGSAASAATCVVVAGDTLSSVAHRHGVSVRSLQDCNQLKNDKIQAGQRLKLPNTGGPKDRVHVVSVGDTLNTLSKRYHVPVSDIKTTNKMTSDLLKPGARLVIARSPAAPTPVRYRPLTPSSVSIPKARAQNASMTIETVDVLRVQILLSNLGFNPGPLDAFLGDCTIAAMAEFAAQHHLDARSAVRKLIADAREQVPDPCMKHLVAQPETLENIACMFGTTIKGLARMNEGVPVENISLPAGTKLFVPQTESPVFAITGAAAARAG